MQATNRDDSVAFSLKELRELEQRRLADEHGKRTAAAAAVAQAQLDAEDAKVAAIEAAARADREARYRVEAARVEAARQERIAVQAAEAQARAQHEAELSAQRLAEEMAIKRIEAHKKRPRWMLAVTAVAIVASAILVGFTVQAVASSNRANIDVIAANHDRDDAIQAQKAADDKLVATQAELARLDGVVNAAIDRVGKATNAAEARKAAAEAAAARADLAAAQQRAEQARIDHEHQIRVGPVKISEKCLQNSLAKECMK